METSYNGWPASPDPKAIGIKPLIVSGVTHCPPGVKEGDVWTVFAYVVEQFDRRVEQLVDGWCWGYAYRKNRNADNLSCHSSGTAIDLNAPTHPNGRRGTFTPTQAAEIREILNEVGGVVRWGGDFSGTPDEMHFEIRGTVAAVARVAAKLGPDGFAAFYTKALVRGDRGPEVRRIRNRLGMPPGDVFDDALNHRVRQIQHRRGWNVNGRIAEREARVIYMLGGRA